MGLDKSGKHIKTIHLKYYRSYRLQKTDFTLVNHCIEKQHIFSNSNASILQKSMESQIKFTGVSGNL